MTALEQFARLEATGLWKENADAQRREVIVSFGKATLVLSDFNEMPLTHWSLAAVDRQGRGLPAIYIIGDEGDETLEIQDALMVEAIEKIRKPLRPAPSHAGSLRLILFLFSMVLTVAAIWFWLPPTLATHTARIIPVSKEVEIGNNIVGYIERFTGRECSSDAGAEALARLHARVLPDQEGRLRVADLGAQPALHLPGDFVLLHIAVLEDFSGPAVVSGYILQEDLIRKATDPITDFFKDAGLVSTIRFLTTGEVLEEDFEAYARKKVTAFVDRPEDEALLSAFEQVQIPSTPFAYAVDPSGNSTKLLLDLDPISGTYPEILRDTDWLALQAICDLN